MTDQKRWREPSPKTRARMTRPAMLQLGLAVLAIVLLLGACSSDQPGGRTDALGPDNLRIVPLGNGNQHGDLNPVPIPGGIQIPDGPLIHVFAPGPEELGLMGLNVEPNVITNFQGKSALAYQAGQATDQDGNVYDMVTDMRVFVGEYVSADGSHHRGTFCFI